MRVFFVFAFVALSLVSHAGADEYLVICSGQSNMGGVASVTSMPDDVRKVPANVVYYRYPDAMKLEPTLAFDGSKNYGPVPRFVVTLAAARPDDRLIILHDAVGGSGLCQWVPDYEPKEIGGKRIACGMYYKLFQLRLAAVKKAHPAAKPLAFIWQQGESDTKGFAAHYGDNLKRLIANVRRDAEAPDLLAIIGEPSLTDQGVYDGIHAFAKEDKYAAYIDTSPLGRGSLHFSAKGYDALGKMYAETMVKLMAGDKPEKR